MMLINTMSLIPAAFVAAGMSLAAHWANKQVAVAIARHAHAPAPREITGL